MKPGLNTSHFHKVCENGFGDGNNAYAHSMTWFNRHLYVGTTRANLCLIRFNKWKKRVAIGVWPVECPYAMHSKDFEYLQARAEIWRFDPLQKTWERVFQAPIIAGKTGDELSREVGYRCMTVFRGVSDKKPALYVSNWARLRGDGPQILRSEDGKSFFPSSKIDLPVSSFRVLVPFKGRLFTAPTGTFGDPNMSGATVVLENPDPIKENWQPVSESSFGDPNNLTIFEMKGFGDHLYAGTVNISGMQVWRTKAEGKPPYKWERCINHGAGRGSLNEITTSMSVFKNALYIGTGIQNGGYDQVNDIGPAGGEIIRINHDGSWDLIVGDIRPDGQRPISGLPAGFGNVCNGYIWKMGVHNGWLYVGTMEWSVFMRYISLDDKPQKAVNIIEKVGVENILENQAGFELWRTSDGKNWLPVTRQGFGNYYNYGVRNIVSTPYGLFIGTANPFGPKVAIQNNGKWTYEHNPDGGLEVWQGI
jgi:hypothetical protein